MRRLVDCYLLFQDLLLLLGRGSASGNASAADSEFVIGSVSAVGFVSAVGSVGFLNVQLERLNYKNPNYQPCTSALVKRDICMKWIQTVKPSLSSVQNHMSPCPKWNNPSSHNIILLFCILFSLVWLCRSRAYCSLSQPQASQAQAKLVPYTCV